MVNYIRDNSSVFFTQQQINELENSLETLSSLELSETPRAEFAEAYRLVLDFAADNGFTMDDAGLALEDRLVLTWVDGAIDVNQGNGYFADYIREYTKKQYELRGGDPSLAEGLNQIASNRICINLLKDIVKNGFLPDVAGLGAIDAGAAASTVFNNLPEIGTEGDYAPWAGTLLFPYFYFDNFSVDLLLSAEPVNGTITDSDGSIPTEFKHTVGTYDLIAAMQSHFIAAQAAGFDNMWEALELPAYAREVFPIRYSPLRLPGAWRSGNPGSKGFQSRRKARLCHTHLRHCPA